MSARKKPGPREPNGKLQRPTAAEREAAAKRAQESEMAVVKAQRIKLGATEENFRDQKWGSALGRFVERRGLRVELLDAGAKFANDRRRIRSLMGLDGGVPLEDGFAILSDEERAELIDRVRIECEEAAQVLRRRSKNHFQLVFALCFEDAEILVDWHQTACQTGLMLLARHYGMLR